MKRIFSLVLLVAAIASTAFAADHYSFMGVPMDGRISQFCNKLVSQKGLKIVERDDERGVYTLSGRFAGYTNCEFYVFDNDNTKQVYQVDVYLPEQSTWNSIKTQYNKIVRDYRSNAAYTFKSSTSDFESPYRDGGGDEVGGRQGRKSRLLHHLHRRRRRAADQDLSLHAGETQLHGRRKLSRQ